MGIYLITMNPNRATRFNGVSNMIVYANSTDLVAEKALALQTAKDVQALSGSANLWSDATIVALQELIPSGVVFRIEMRAADDDTVNAVVSYTTVLGDTFEHVLEELRDALRAAGYDGADINFSDAGAQYFKYLFITGVGDQFSHPSIDGSGAFGGALGDLSGYVSSTGGGAVDTIITVNFDPDFPTHFTGGAIPITS